MQPGSDAAKIMLKPIMTLECPIHHDRTYSYGSMSYFPDGKRIISGLWDKIVRQWDLQTGKEIENARDVHEHGGLVVAVSRDGRWVVTVTGEGLHIWAHKETETGIVKTFVGHIRGVRCIDISVDSSLLASDSEDSTLWIWSMETGKLVAGPFKCHWVGEIRFSQDSKKLAVESCSMKCLETIYEFDASTLDTVGVPFEGHTKDIHGLACSFDGALLASISWDNTIKLWAVETGIVKTIAGHSAGITCVDISMDSSLLASGSEDSTARLWSLETGKLVAGPFKTAGRVGAIRFSQDSKKFVVESWSTQCLEFDPSKLDTVGIPFEGHTKYINCLALSFDGALLASTSDDNTIKLWAVESHQLLSSFDGHVEFVSSISYCPDRKRMVSGSYDKTVRQWDLQTGKEIEKSRDVCKHQVGMVAVSRDGRRVITIDGDEFYGRGELKVCEVETGIVKKFVGHTGEVRCFDISMDSSLLASGSEDSTAQIWSLETGKLVAGPFILARLEEARGGVMVETLP
ncbi:WD40 repeat-like protein [Rhizopogon vinicolor AM-OR11-026]|uniref:WD40 repeat-like protein n=1 Tax=Rhizopogon vinicolor AM-OR11-026 TaxID=1314800 RepID=A0A1B7N2D5_9AGAM|nr:WD40 repeat-like protein [Rhizopogon vinicolor AM-OR11-026]